MYSAWIRVWCVRPLRHHSATTASASAQRQHSASTAPALNAGHKAPDIGHSAGTNVLLSTKTKKKIHQNGSNANNHHAHG